MSSTDTYHTFAFHDPLVLRLTLYAIYALETTQTVTCIIEAVNQFSANIGDITVIYTNRPTWPVILLMTSMSTSCLQCIPTLDKADFSSCLRHPFHLRISDKSIDESLEGTGHHHCRKSHFDLACLPWALLVAVR